MSDSLILRKLRQPYGFHTSIKRRWILCLLFGSFVFLFLYFFRPFDISYSPVGVFNACLGYGLTTFVIMAVLNIALLPVFPKFMNEESWTVGKEIGWSLLNIFLIGLGNVLFGAFVGNVQVSFIGIAVVEMYTMAIGIFPVTVSVLVKEARLKKRYEQESQQINEGIREHIVPGVEETKVTELTKEEAISAGLVKGKSAPVLIRIDSENAGEYLELFPDDLLYIRSSDNYIEVFYTVQNVVSRKLLRNSLKAVSESLETDPRFFRCHKSYLVNLRKVTHVSGNAQGYKLHIPETDVQVPVSRQHNVVVKERLAGIS
jgi:DNA-binding LytR/AlgR family response regulator